MQIDIITCLPKLLESPFNQSIVHRAKSKGLVTVDIHDLRDYSINKHKQVDDYAYGVGAGMVLMVEPILKCIEQLQAKRTYDEIIYMTPDGETFDQPMANQLSLKKNLIIICGHYKGIDERIREHLVTKEISIGDFVLSGGELAAAVVSDAIIRLLPGVLSDETSALTDSFQDGLLAPPVYTRPAQYKDWSVPDILLSGNEAKIEQWRMDQAVERTKTRRPDMYEKFKKDQMGE
ncbi:MAG: tRNA (guanosine(37)-N1)-methyltransferase TrmD [Flammeovirgaceae bacterium]|nr:tRNA (guanosine(37)-N1)-methyltransferase TrmD [Flammeovirgaceae bacterium]